MKYYLLYLLQNSNKDNIKKFIQYLDEYFSSLYVMLL